MTNMDFCDSHDLENGSCTSDDEVSKDNDNIANISSHQFDAFKYTYAQLRLLVVQMFDNLNLTKLFKIDKKKLSQLLVRLEGLYQRVPYHSFRHCMDVTQFIYHCLCNEELRQMLTPLDQLCILSTGLVHDTSHPGVNNQLLSLAGHELAQQFKDSPLEEFHCFLAGLLFEQDQCNIVENLTESELEWFRTGMSHIILATDMKHHFNLRKEMDERIKNGLKPDNPQDRLMVMTLIMKCGDVSNVTREFSTARHWAERVIEEFCSQGDLQREINQREGNNSIEIDKLFDRHRLDFPESQLGFIRFVAKGQFQTLVHAFPSMAYLLQAIDETERRWAQYQQSKDKNSMEFEIHLRTVGSAIKEPLRNVLKSPTLINQHVDADPFDIQLTKDEETSLIRQKLREKALSSGQLSTS